jgi:Ribosomal protein L1p/L10e family
VLVDDRIIRLVPNLLGKPFYKKKKLPVSINLTSKKLKEEVRILQYQITIFLFQMNNLSPAFLVVFMGFFLQ